MLYEDLGVPVSCLETGERLLIPRSRETAFLRGAGTVIGDDARE
jgi:hypothetical protein